MPRTTKPKIIWENDIINIMKQDITKHPNQEPWSDTMRMNAHQTIMDRLKKITDQANKLVDGTIYLIGTMQMHGKSVPASRSLGTNNVAEAINKAVTIFTKEDNAISLYLAEDELVIAARGYNDLDTPSVFSFRCVPEGGLKEKSADTLAEISSSIAPLIKRTVRVPRAS